jgi:hypothetical protein
LCKNFVAGHGITECLDHRRRRGVSRTNKFLCAFKILAQQFREGMRGAVPVQHFPGPIIEHRLHSFDLPNADALPYFLPIGPSARSLISLL